MVLPYAVRQLLSLSLSGQQSNWILSPHELQFPSGALQVNIDEYPGLASDSYTSENSVYDEDELVFYVRDGQIFDGNQAFVGAIKSGINSSDQFSKEIVIAPMPGQCEVWCVMSFYIDPPADIIFFVQEVKLVDGEVQLGTYEEPDIFFGPTSIALSRSQNLLYGSRDIYVVAGGVNLYKYKLTTNGLSERMYIGEEPMSVLPALQSEMDATEKFTVFGSGASLRVINTNGEQVAPLVTAGDVTGVELWGVDEERSIYLSVQGVGIFECAFTIEPNGHVASLDNLTKVPNSPLNVGFGNAHLELGADGRMYTVSDEGDLYAIDEDHNWFDVGINLSSNAYTLVNLGEMYALPDQVDLESSDFFYGIQPPVITDLLINDQSICADDDPTTPNDQSIRYFNCAPLNFRPTGQFNLVIYESINIVSVDDQDNPTPYLSYSRTFPAGTLPGTVDLRCLEGHFDCDLFSNALEFGDRFRLTYTADNGCETVSKTCFFSMGFEPQPAQVDLMINPGTGNLQPVSTDISAPVGVGLFSGGIDFQNAGGQASYYRLSIDEVHCTTAAILESLEVNGGENVDIASVADLGSISFNSLEILGSQSTGGQAGTGYFANNSSYYEDKCLRVSVEVGNVCGAIEYFSYINFDGYYLTAPIEDTYLAHSVAVPNEQTGAEVKSSRSSDHYFEVFPNPVSARLHVRTNDEAATQAWTVYDARGRVVLRHFSETDQFVLDVANLPSGLYTLMRSLHGGRVATQTFLRQ